MPNLSALANIPGYGAYVAKRQMNEAQMLQDLQQASALMNLKNSIQAQRDEQQLKATLAESAGDVDAAMAAALKAGRPDVAAKLAPIAEARRKATAVPQPRVVAPGGALVNDSGEVIFQAPFKPAEAPADPNEVRLVDFYQKLPDTDPRKAMLKQFIDAKTRGPEKADKTYPIVHTAEGIFERRPEGLVPLKDPGTGKNLNPTVRERPITEYQGKNAMYGVRASMSHKTLMDLEDKISVTGLAVKRGVQDIPVVGGPLGAAANVALSKDQQKVEQAQRNFVNAVLRQESGAVINPSEFENAIKQYFPQPGDKKDVIEQKRKNRLAVIEGFRKIAGPAWSDAEATTPAADSAEDVLRQADEILRGKR